MKDSYSPLEVITLLVNNNNRIISMIDKSKYFVIEGEFVVTYRKRFLVSDDVLNRVSFDRVIIDAGGIY